MLLARTGALRATTPFICRRSAHTFSRRSGGRRLGGVRCGTGNRCLPFCATVCYVARDAFGRRTTATVSVCRRTCGRAIYRAARKKRAPTRARPATEQRIARPSAHGSRCPLPRATNAVFSRCRRWFTTTYPHPAPTTRIRHKKTCSPPSNLISVGLLPKRYATESPFSSVSRRFSNFFGILRVPHKVNKLEYPLTVQQRVG